jgi:hypothetical protein
MRSRTLRQLRFAAKQDDRRYRLFRSDNSPLFCLCNQLKLNENAEFFPLKSSNHWTYR